MHGPLKDSYLLRTNKKNFAEQVCSQINLQLSSFLSIKLQILHYDHLLWVSALIQDQLDELDDFLQPGNASIEDAEDFSGTLRIDDGHITLGAPLESCTFQNIEEIYTQDKAFKDFRKQLASYMNTLLPASRIELPGGQRLQFSNEDTVCLISLIFFSIYSINFIFNTMADHRIQIPQGEL